MNVCGGNTMKTIDNTIKVCEKLSVVVNIILTVIGSTSVVLKKVKTLIK